MHSRQSTLRARPAYTNLRPGRGASNRSVPYKIQRRLLPTRASRRTCGVSSRIARAGPCEIRRRTDPRSPGIRPPGRLFLHLTYAVITAIPAGQKLWRRSRMVDGLLRRRHLGFLAPRVPTRHRQQDVEYPQSGGPLAGDRHARSVVRPDIPAGNHCLDAANRSTSSDTVTRPCAASANTGRGSRAASPVGRSGACSRSC